MSEENTDKPQSKPTWRFFLLFSIGVALFIGQVVLCVLFYNWAGLDWLLYLGWASLVGGLLLVTMARRALKGKGGATEGESWVATTGVVESGIYAVIRHPMFLCFIWVSLALILISQYWLSPIFGVPIIVLLYLSMRLDERASIEKFGDDYKCYMQSVPRMSLALGFIRLLRRRKRG